MTTKRGFTLIEILVVIVIIGITVGFALIAFGDFGESKRVLFAAEQLSHNLRLAQQQAILESSTLGLRIDKTSYQILKYQNGSSWGSISDKGIFKTYYFPQKAIVTLKTNTKPVRGMPAVIINSSGDLTPFDLEFRINKDEVLVTVTGYQDGVIKLTGAQSK